MENAIKIYIVRGDFKSRYSPFASFMTPEKESKMEVCDLFDLTFSSWGAGDYSELKRKAAPAA